MDLNADLGLENWSACAVLPGPWRDPAAAAAPFAEEPWTMALLSDGSRTGRWSYLLRRPAAELWVEPSGGRDPFQTAAARLGPRQASVEGGPPFQGGVAGLFVYEAGLAREPSVGAARSADWPDAAAALYPALLAFDHREGRVLALGRGADAEEAQARAAEALSWLDRPATAEPVHGALASDFAPVGSGEAYETVVAEVVAKIAAGEIFQANAARTWAGRLARGAAPFDLFVRLARTSPAPFSAYLRLPGRAVVSNSPERFIKVDADGRAETRPIKGTRPRGATPEADAALAAELAASAKDQAENLMIVDLMRNDLARACRPGTVRVPELFRLERFANVHHLVSTVTGELSPGEDALDLLGCAFPPGSITGAPKVQAMRVIAGCEPPRGPYCGSIAWAGFDGALDSSVLIRTAALVQEPGGRWRFEVRAGAGIVADSDPRAENEETEAKVAALRRALTEPLPSFR